MSMSIAETILANASGKENVKPGEYLTASIDKFISHEAFAAVHMNLEACQVTELSDPDKVIVVLDHYTPAPTQRAASIHQLVTNAVKKYGIERFYGQNSGIAHQVMMEKGHVLPGDLIVGTDSHTCTYGAFGAAASGIGFSDFTYAVATGTLWFMVPETVRFVLAGELAAPTSSKDIILYIAGRYSSQVAQYMSAEFTGPVAERMSMESRMVVSNMAVEIGAKFGFFLPDDKTYRYLGQDADPMPARLTFDPDAPVSHVYEIDVTHLEPQVALPHSVDNVKPVHELPDIEVQQAVLGSCTNGRIEDLRIAAHIVKGRKVNPSTRLLVIPASMNVYRQAMDEGILATFMDAGAVVLNPGCGPCFGGHMGLLAAGERCISSTNRNFKGRMGSDRAEVYLASPATVTASAVRGRITDPRDI